MNKILKYSNLYMEFPTKIIKIEKLQIIEEFNEHGLAIADMVVLSENEYRFIDDITSSTEIKVVLKTDDNTDCIFIGVASNISVKRENQYYYVNIELKSKSFLLDCKLIKRSFQNKDNPYKNLFNQAVERDYGKVVIYDMASNGKVQEESIIQYEETDWQFIKRLASKLNAKIVTDVRKSSPTICIGKYLGESFDEITHSFQLAKENEEFSKFNLNYGGWKEGDKIFYKIKSVNKYELSDNVTYGDIKFKICKKETVLEKGLIVFIYRLVKESGLKQTPIFNSKILGASIDGKILDVEVDRVKIHLCIDDSQPIGEAYWYKYETSYTTEGQTGFYSMPQKGDDVKLYTPTEFIEDAYVRTVNRLDGDKNIKIQDPDVKYYGNIDKKELMLAPTELQLTATNGLVLLNMDNDDGIEFTSSSDILIKTQATGKISGKKIGIRAGNEVLLATKESSIIINSNIHIRAEVWTNL